MTLEIEILTVAIVFLHITTVYFLVNRFEKVERRIRRLENWTGID